MRKHFVWILAAAAAVSVAGVAWADSTGQDQSGVSINVKPTKLSKKNYSKASLTVETTTLSNSNPGTPTNPGNVPGATSDVKLTFDKDLKFTTKGLAQCDVNKLANTTTQQALALCKSSKVGQGSAVACIGAAGTPCTAHFPFVVTAFNGKPKGKKSTIILHSRNNTLGGGLTTVLVGTLDPKKNVLDVPVPSLPATITDFKTTVGKTYKSKGKKYNYVSARCSHKQLNLKGKFSYVNGDPADSVSANQPCQGK